MNCKHVQRRLNAYLDGELPAGMRGWLEAHLEVCSACTQELARHRKLRRLLDGLPSATTPEGFARSVRERASLQALGARRPAAPELWRVAPIAMRVAAVLALGVGLLLGGFMGRSAAVTRTARQAATAEELSQELSLDLLTAVTPGSVTEAYLELTGNSE